MKDKKTKYVIYSIVITLILCLGFTFAFFTAKIQKDEKDVVIKAGELKVKFTDTTEIVNENVQIGWNASKTFKVENESNKVFKYNIFIKDLVNTLITDGYLQYKITSTDGYSMNDFAPIGKSKTESNFELVNDITIPAKGTQEYTIEFRYIDDPEIDQSEDMGKTFSGKLMIEENNA